MTDFNKICCRPVIEFLTLENIQPQPLLFTVKVHHHMPQSSAGQLSFVEAEEALKMSPSQDICLKLSAKKTVMLLKISYCKIIESVSN